MGDLSFEWDEQKADANEAKHGISFEEASTVFYDEAALLIGDPDHSEDENRFVLLGMSVVSRVLVVCKRPANRAPEPRPRGLTATRS